MKYNLVSEVTSFVEDFDTKSIDVVSMPQLSENKRKKATKYTFNQREMIAKIDMASLSQFETGMFDHDGQRKLYLNKVNFIVDVADKSTDIDTRNFVFIPEGFDSGNTWKTWLIGRQFKNYVKDTGLAEVLNETKHIFNKYGSVVVKICKGDENEIEVVPLQSLRNDQSACSLEDGIYNGSFVIIEHAYSYDHLKEYPGWKVPEKRYKGTKTVYEVYGLMPELDEKGMGDADGEYKMSMAIIAPDLKDKVLFYEEIEELPFIEVHDTKIEGRWLGLGEVEKQLENQIAANLIVNLQRRSMLWASKKVFQSKGASQPKSLASGVNDGDILQVDMNGDIVEVNTSTRAGVDYNQGMQIWGENSQQKGFAFEAQTGESMPSGQPFRLGAMLSNASQGYFDMKKEKLGLFWKDVFWELILPTFKKTAKRDIEIIASTDDGYSMIKELAVELKTQEYITKFYLSENAFKYEAPNTEEVKAKIEQELIKSPYIFITDITKDLYKTAKYRMDLDITGESVEPADKETMITLYTTLAQKGDPRADKVLENILSLMGKNMKAIAGNTPTQNTTATNPNLQGLVPQQ